MHILITSDTVGGVWTHTQELVSGLVRAGHQITLVSFGKLPLPHQTAWMKVLPRLDYRPTEYRLEWMEVADRDIEESRRYLELLVREVRPDVLHFSQYCYGDLPADLPRIVVAHSDVVSWWAAVHGCEPQETPWMRRYRQHVIKGLQAADSVVAPSRWMLDAVCKHYVHPRQETVIYNGRTPALFNPHSPKEDFILSVGRIWDEGKHISLLLKRELPGQICIVGWEQEPGREGKETTLNARDNVRLLGPKAQSELKDIYAAAAVYVATSRYEPFGLSPLEAALSGCALVMNDNPAFRELWGDAALYFERDNADDLALRLSELKDAGLLREYEMRAYQRACDRFTAERMVAQYEKIYQDVCSTARVA